MDAKALSSLLCTLVTAGSGRSSAPRWDEQPSSGAPRRPQQKRPSTRRPPNRSRSFKEPGSSYRSFDSSPSSSSSTSTSSFTSSFFTTTTTHHTINIKNQTVTHHNTSFSDDVDNLKSDDSFDLPMHSGFEKEYEPESRRSASFDEYDREPELSPHRYSSFSSFPGFSTRPLPLGGELYTGSSTPSPSSSCSSSPSSSAVELSQFVPAESLMRLLSSPLGPPPEHDAASSTSCCCEDEKGGLHAGTGWVLWYDTSERKEAGLSKSSFLRKLKQYPAPIHTFRDFSIAVLYLLLGTSQKAGGASSPFSLSAQRLPGFMDEQENEHMIEQQLWDLETKLCLLSKEEEETGVHAEAHEDKEKRKDKDSKDKDETNGDWRKPSAGLGFGVVGMREVGLHLFRAGVAPVWEDRANRSGGSWLLSFPSYLPALRSALATIAALFSGQLDSSGICGIVVTSKPKKGGKVSLWTGNRENTKCARFSQISHLVHPLCTSMFFRPHALRLYPPSSPTKPKKQKSKKSGNTKKRGKAKKSLNMGDAVAAAASAADTPTITASDPNAPPAPEKTPTKSRRRKGGPKSKGKKEEQAAPLTQEPLYAPGAPPGPAATAVVTTSAEAVSCVDAATSDSTSAGFGFHLPADLMELCAPVVSSTSPATSTDSKPSELCPVFFSPRSSATLPVSDVSSIHLEPVVCTPAPVEKVESSSPPIAVPLPTPTTSEVCASQAVVAQPLGLMEPCVHAPPKAARAPMYALPILYVFLLMAFLVLLLITFFAY